MRYQSCVVTEVRDNGAGMCEELQGKIFDPFFTTKESGGGMGLGLALVDRIVREFAGFVDVVSHPGEGSCFSIWLPLATEADTPPEEKTP